MRPDIFSVVGIVSLLFTLFTLAPSGAAWSQSPDSLLTVTDSGAVFSDSLHVAYDTSRVMRENTGVSRPPSFKRDISETYTDLRNLPVPQKNPERKRVVHRPEILFYVLMLVALLLGVLKLSFPSYFNNLFRVFFNSSLRQSQLTEQLLQALLPSVFFNLFFFISGGVYVFLVLGHFGKLDLVHDIRLLPVFIAGLLGIYLFKFLWLKFIGWVSGMPEELNAYIFIVYLVNKMAGICMLPFLPVLAFSDKPIAAVAVLLSVIVLGFMLVVRFLRSYALAAARMHIPAFHFLLYIISLELLPLLIFFKMATLILDKNL